MDCGEILRIGAYANGGWLSVDVRWELFDRPRGAPPTCSPRKCWGKTATGPTVAAQTCQRIVAAGLPLRDTTMIHYLMPLPQTLQSKWGFEI